MKQLFGTVLLAAVGLSLTSAQDAAAQTQKFGFVNSGQIVAQAPGAAEARQSLEAEMQGYRTELDQLETQLDSMQTAYERQQSSLSATARQERQQALQQAVVEG